MSYQPHLHKGGELYHFRTKGSKNGVSNTPGYKAVGKKALGFLNSAGQYVYNNASKAAGAAKEFVTGNKAKAQFNKADWRARNTGSTTIGKGYNNSRETQERIGMARYTNARRADAANKAYGKTLPGIAQNTKAAIKTTGKNVGNWLNNRAGDAKKAGNAIGEAASSAYKNAREFITGENAKKELDRTTKGFSGLVTGKSGKKKAKEQYGKTLPGMIDNAKKGINDIINDPKKAADDARKNAGNWLKERGGDIAKAAGSAKKAAGDLADKASKSIPKLATDAKKAAADTISGAGKTASKAAKSVSKFASDSFDSAKKVAGEGTKRAGEFINGLTKKKEKSKSNIKPIETKPIETKPIETKPIETKAKKQKVDAKAFTKFVVDSNKNANKSSVSTNDKPNGVSDEYWRDYKFNGGTRESYDKEMKARSSSKSSSKSKTNMSDKPKNVSDEYWEAYTSNGGTRESYDNEMKARSKAKSSSKSSSKSNASDKPKTIDPKQFDHFTFDKETGQTVWVDKNGKKHYN